MGDSVPDSWDQSILGNYCDIKGGKRLPKGRPFSASRTNYPYVRVSDFSHGSISFEDLKFVDEDTRDQIARYTISSSDLYISIAGTLGLVGSVPSKLDGALLTENAAKIIFRDREKSDKYFFKYLLNSDNCQRHFNSAKGTGGGVPKLALFRIEDTEISVPSLPEQKKIATILTSVDTVIEKTQAQIDKLNDLKTGMMQELLTKGIGPDGKPHTEFKDSPVGRIPVGWEVENLKNILSGTYSGWSPVCEQRNRVGLEFGILKTTAVTWAGYTDSENKALPKEYEAVESAIVQKHDILITRKGPRERVGVCAFVNDTKENLMIPDTVFRVTLKNEAETNPAFITLILSSDFIQRDWDKKKVGLAEAQVNINHSILNQTKIALPEPSEQLAIIERLTAVDEYLKKAIERHASLELVKKALMQDLLTGKVRVTPDPE